MAQYCRYCAWAYGVEDGVLWCEKRDQTFTAKQAKHTNTCEQYALNAIDALRENAKGYKPTGIRIIQFGGLGEQIEMDVGGKKRKGRRDGV